MSIVARKFTACPVRTGSETWSAIVTVIADGAPAAAAALANIVGVASSIIADRTPASNPITIIGTGARLRVYCIYDEDAMSDEASEAKLSWPLFEKDDWEIHFPVEKEDFNWVTSLLKEKGTRYKTYKAGEIPVTEKRSEDASNELSINLEKFKSNG